MNFPQEHVFPTKRDENWKYTSLKSWLEKPYTLSDSKGQAPSIQSAFAHKIVFVNGCFKSELSQLPPGVTVRSEASPIPAHQDSLVLLNARFTKNVTVIEISSGAELTKALHILFVTSSANSPSMNFPQVRFQVGAKAKASILVEHSTAQADEVTFVSSWMATQVAAEAQVEFVILQNQNLQSFHYEKAHFSVAEKAQLKVLEVALGSLLSRSEAEIDIKGSEISAHLLGVYALAQNQQSDHYTSVKHLVGGSNTVQVYKGLLADKSKGVFNGHVMIAPDAQKANSEQLNKNLLLSQDAEVNSKPELEIYADDVKATHGSTIGQIQKEEVFYLQTRGIKKEKAIQLVSEAFVMDVVQQLDNAELKTAVKKAMQAKGAVK